MRVDNIHVCSARVLVRVNATPKTTNSENGSGCRVQLSVSCLLNDSSDETDILQAIGLNTELAALLAMRQNDALHATVRATPGSDDGPRILRIIGFLPIPKKSAQVEY